MANVNFNEEFKDRWLKFLVAGVATVLLLLLIYITKITFAKVNKGEHVKIFGIEYNIPNTHPDTIYKTIVDTIRIPTNSKVSESGKKTFNNKIGKVTTLDEH